MLYTVILHHVGEPASKRSKKYPLTPIRVMTMSQEGVARMKRYIQREFNIDEVVFNEYVLTRPVDIVTWRNNQLPFVLEIRPLDEKFMLIDTAQTLKRLVSGTLDMSSSSLAA